VAVAVAGGVLTLGGAAVFDRSVDSSPLDPSAAEASLNVDTTGDGSAVALATDPQRVARSSPPPVLAADPPALDVAALTTAVRRAGEEAAAQRRAADERRADGPGDEAEEERRAEPEDPASAERTSTGRAERSTRSSPAPAGGCGLSTKGLG
jgi:septal ring-binding cell division protein DamX